MSFGSLFQARWCFFSGPISFSVPAFHATMLLKEAEAEASALTVLHHCCCHTARSAHIWITKLSERWWFPDWIIRYHYFSGWRTDIIAHVAFYRASLVYHIPSIRWARLCNPKYLNDSKLPGHGMRDLSIEQTRMLVTESKNSMLGTWLEADATDTYKSTFLAQKRHGLIVLLFDDCRSEEKPATRANNFSRTPWINRGFIFCGLYSQTC